MRIESRQIDESELGELPKQREVRLQMVHKLREACLWPLEVCKRHHRQGRRGIATKKHRELVDEVANRGLAGLLSTINLRGKEVSWYLQLVAEIAHLFMFG